MAPISRVLFVDASFDVVCEFSILHHVQRPDVVVREVLWVAEKVVVLGAFMIGFAPRATAIELQMAMAFRIRTASMIR